MPIQTTRLTLRHFQASDAETLQRIYQTAGVLRYFPAPANPAPIRARVERYLARQQAHWDQYGRGHWAVTLTGAAEILGWVGLQYLPELDETEVGYLLDPAYWGRGYATEAARASLQFGFEHFPFDHQIALVHPDNLASRRVIEKCGLRYVETIRLWGMELMRHRLERP